MVLVKRRAITMAIAVGMAVATTRTIVIGITIGMAT